MYKLCKHEGTLPDAVSFLFNKKAIACKTIPNIARTTMGHMPQPRFDFNNFIETAPALHESRDIVDLVQAECETRERILETIADELYSVVPESYPRKDVLWGTIIQTLSDASAQAFDDFHTPYVEKSAYKNLPDIVIEKAANDIRATWAAMLIDLQDYLANQVMASNRNASPSLQNG